MGGVEQGTAFLQAIDANGVLEECHGNVVVFLGLEDFLVVVADGLHLGLVLGDLGVHLFFRQGEQGVNEALHVFDELGAFKIIVGQAVVQLRSFECMGVEVHFHGRPVVEEEHGPAVVLGPDTQQGILGGLSLQGKGTCVHSHAVEDGVVGLVGEVDHLQTIGSSAFH